MPSNNLLNKKVLFFSYITSSQFYKKQKIPFSILLFLQLAK
ncbi:hypothetical protein M211_2421 [Acinetobacter lactucae]|nr:hypothetical protein M211_2421 [Acinetobacter lactucae]